MTLFELGEQTTSGPVGPLVRVRLLVAYDGTDYAGMAKSPGMKTVAGALTASIELVLRHPVKLTVAGRTDAGVHAWGQVVTFDASPDGLDTAALQRSLNKLCAPAIVVREITVEPDTFDARYSARSRRYRYTIVNRRWPDPFLLRTAWHVDRPLDLPAMRLACDPLFGVHDFTAFCRRPTIPAGVPFSMVRRIIEVRWHDLGDDVLRFDIEATAFCQQMVRSIVGTVVDVGLGKMRAADIAALIRSEDRGLAGQVAPARGLCLWEVVY